MIASLVSMSLSLCPQGESSFDYEFVDAFPEQKRFDKPLYLDAHETDPASYYVVEQDGAIWRIPRAPDGSDRSLFLDWSEHCHRQNWEEGLLGFAFDPSYEDNRSVYIYYSEGLEKGARQSVISRLSVEELDGAPVADEQSELRLLTVPQPFGNHNGGTILFGPDDMLYVALGDGGHRDDPHDNGQDLTTLLASVLRIDVRGATAEQPYRVPEDNPFVDHDGEGVRGEIWAYGLRNPWRITFDRDTGELWCGDVGQNLWEEVDKVVRGGNYGWNHREGMHEFERRAAEAAAPGDLREPVAEYGREEGLSITGGYIYRGQRIPDLVGCYVYGDFVTRRVWAVRPAAGDGPGEVQQLGVAPGPIASFAEEPNGELLALCFDGRIYRLQVRAE